MTNNTNCHINLALAHLYKAQAEIDRASMTGDPTSYAHVMIIEALGLSNSLEERLRVADDLTTDSPV